MPADESAKAPHRLATYRFKNKVPKQARRHPLDMDLRMERVAQTLLTGRLKFNLPLCLFPGVPRDF